MSSRCSCLNGGVCMDTFVQACRCQNGYFGSRCQDVELGFVQSEEDGSNVELIVIVSLFCFVFVVSVAVCFFTWRRRRSKKRKETEMLELRSRRQSRATIEGVSYTGASKEDESDDNSLKRVLIVPNYGETGSTNTPRPLSRLKIFKSETIKKFLVCSVGSEDPRFPDICTDLTNNC